MQRLPDNDALSLVALQDQLAQARQSGDRWVEQLLHLRLAQEYLQLRRFDEARLSYAEASLLSLFTGASTVRLIAGIGEGKLFLWNRQPEQARARFAEMLELAREQGHRQGEAECLSGLAHTALLTGAWRRSLQQAEQARAIFREQGMWVDEADTLVLLANAHTQSGQFEQAVSLHREGIFLARRWNVAEIEATHLTGLGILEVRELAQPEQGMADLLRALALFRERGDEEDAAHTLALLAAGALHQHQWEEALRYAQQAQSLAHRLKWLESQLHFLAADAFAGLGRREEALRERGLAFASLFPQKALLLKSLFEDHHAALAQARARGDRREEVAQLLSLAYAETQGADLRGYLAYYEQALDVYRALGDLHELGGYLVNLGVGLALSYPGKRLRSKRARALAYWRAGLDIGRAARQARSAQDGAPGGEELDAAPGEGEQALTRRYEEMQLERLRKRWGQAAYQRAWDSSEGHYRALLSSFAPSEGLAETHACRCACTCKSQWGTGRNRRREQKEGRT